MNSLRGFLPLLVPLFLAGCTSGAARTEPPAPVYERGQRVGDARSADGQGTVTTVPIGGPEVSVGAGLFDSATPMPETSRPVPEQSATTPTSVAYAPLAAEPATAAQPMGGAALSLVNQADARVQGGDLTGAASLLERAVRLEPRHPLPWNRLAHVRFGQGSYALASELAEKSNALAGTDRSLKRNNWQLIAQSRRHVGDEDGARTAQRQADGLR